MLFSSLLLLVLFLAAARIAGLLLVPVFCVSRGRVKWWRWRTRFDDSGILYFHALRALMQSGLGFSAALDRLAQNEHSPFAVTMRDRLKQFERGGDFLNCLEDFPRYSRLPLLDVSLQSLALAYRQGLPLGPLLDRIAPALERERDEAAGIAQVRHSVLAQALVAFCVPWVVLLALLMWSDLEGVRPSLYSVCVVLGWEAFGLGVLWKCSAFR